MSSHSDVAAIVDAVARRPIVWLAYYSDWSGMAVFSEEIDALRHAVERSGMHVALLANGQTFGPGDGPQ